MPTNAVQTDNEIIEYSGNCPRCGMQTDVTESMPYQDVEGYDECLECLAADPETFGEVLSETDPETVDDWKYKYPDLFTQHLMPQHLIDKAKVLVAWIEGQEFSTPSHPDHDKAVYKVFDLARDIKKATKNYREMLDKYPTPTDPRPPHRR